MDVVWNMNQEISFNCILFEIKWNQISTVLHDLHNAKTHKYIFLSKIPNFKHIYSNLLK